MIEHSPGQIFTFYSYKGGTGRSMALANVAWILASNGKRTLVIDWDFEAPGLHRYFSPFLSDPNLKDTDGLIEYLSNYLIAATKSPPSGTKDDERWYEYYADLKRYAEPVLWSFPQNGSIDFVGAGRQDPTYGQRINSFDWNRFYDKFGGGAFLNEAIRQMKEDYDYILVDSRTGVSDTSGICTIQMPDTIVVFYTLNNQSIEGASGVAESIVKQHMEIKSGEEFRLFPMATRIELAEKEKLENQRKHAQNRFRAFVNAIPSLDKKQKEEYWGKMEVLYDPYYAYEEVLATIADIPGHMNSVLAALENLTGLLTKQSVNGMPAISESKRQEALQTYADLGSSKLKPNVESKKPRIDYDVFISSSHKDKAISDRLYYLLEPNYSVFYAPQSIQAGDRWEIVLNDALENSKLLVILLTEHLEKEQAGWLSREVDTALYRQKRDPSFKIIPVKFGKSKIPGIINEKLGSFQWIISAEENIQDISVQIRKLLGADLDKVSEDESNERLRFEIDQALKEKDSLNSKLKESEKKHTLLQERSKEQERKYKKQRWQLISISIGFLIGVIANLVYFGITEKFLDILKPDEYNIEWNFTDLYSEPISGAEILFYKNENDKRGIGRGETADGILNTSVKAREGDVVWMIVRDDEVIVFNDSIGITKTKKVVLKTSTMDKK